MDFDLKTEHQVLLKRTQFQGTVTYNGKTPARKDLKAALAKHLKSPEDLVIVQVVKPVFGHQRAKVMARLYQDRATLDSLEPLYLRKAHGLVEDKAKDARKPAEGS